MKSENSTVSVCCRYATRPAPQSEDGPSARVQAVAAMFGLGVDEKRDVAVVPDTAIPVRRAQVVFVTGPSGSGKSTLLRSLAAAAATHLPQVRQVDFAAPGDVADAPLVDALPVERLEDALRLLSLAGLNDAFVMLRRPSELSDGQAYRFRLARAMAVVEAQAWTPNETCDEQGELPAALLLADEFGAALDRLTAKVLARNLRRWVERTGVCAVVATTHDDVLEAVRPDVLIEQRLGGTLVLHDRRAEPSRSRKRGSA